jgi:ATP-dependent Clp protease protease subunit
VWLQGLHEASRFIGSNAAGHILMSNRVNYDAVESFFDYGVHIPSRTIYVSDSEGSAIDHAQASRVAKALHLLQWINPNEAITVYITTVGGDVHAGMAIYDAMHHCSCHITGIVLGAAMSMGAVILEACDERRMHANGSLMLHDGTMAMDDHARTFENWAGWCKQSRQQMYNIFAKRTGRTSSYWEKRCGYDMILTAQQALKERLIDSIIGE